MNIVADKALHHLLGLLLRAIDRRLHELIVLRRDNDGMNAQGLTRLVVLDRYLTLGIGTQVGHNLALATDNGQLLEDNVRENERSGHKLAGLVAGIAEHNTLIASALLIVSEALDTLIDIRRLLVDSREHTTRCGIELILALVIADTVDDATRHALNIDIGLRLNLARNYDQTRRTERLASYL